MYPIYEYDRMKERAISEENRVCSGAGVDFPRFLIHEFPRSILINTP
jgi:hypothetical protein